MVQGWLFQSTPHLRAESFPLPHQGCIVVIGFSVTGDCWANVSLNGRPLFHPVKWPEVLCR